LTCVCSAITTCANCWLVTAVLMFLIAMVVILFTRKS